jgi:hypothetical protein
MIFSLLGVTFARCPTMIVSGQSCLKPNKERKNRKIEEIEEYMMNNKSSEVFVESAVVDMGS